jgi:peptide/nickel transport system substrate-binding protein
MDSESSFSRRKFLAVAAVGAAALLAACGGNDYPTIAPQTPAASTGAAGGSSAAPGSTARASTAPSSAPSAAPAGGGSANIPTPRNQTVVFETSKLSVFDSFNPYIPSGEQYQAGNVQGAREAMFYFDFPTGRLIPWLATKYEYNADFTQLTLALNPAAKWSDGKPYTSDDILFTLDMLKKNAQFNGSAAVTTWVDTAEAPNPNTVVLKLKQANPRYHYNFVAGITVDVIKIAPKHVWEKQDPGTFKNNPPVYTGPYVLDRVIPEQFMYVWKRNPDYWNKANLDPKPQYAVYRQALTPDASVQEFTRANTDITNSIDYPLQQSFKTSYKDWVQVIAADVCPRGVWLNQDSPSGLFQTAAGRQAISYLLDRDLIAKTIWQPASRAAKYPWADWSANDKFVAPEIQKKYDLVFDPQKAGQLLDGLGATMNGGVRQLNGKPLALTMITPVEVGKNEYQIGQSLAENAKKIGIDIQIRSLVGTPFDDAYNNGQYDLTSHWLCGSALDPGQLYTLFEERFYQPIGTRTTQGNPTRTRIPELNEIAAKINRADPNDPANKATFDQGLDVFMKNLPAIPVIQTVFPIAYNTTYWTGWPTNENLYNVPQWWWQQFIFVLGKIQPTGK